MKKIWDILVSVVEVLCVIDALLNVLAGDATGWDYGILYIAGSWLVAIIVRKVCEEIKIQKKLKQMREEEKNRKNNDTGMAP